MTEQWQTDGDEARRLEEIEAHLSGAAEHALSPVVVALFAILEEAAPQPSTAFGRGLFDELRG